MPEPEFLTIALPSSVISLSLDEKKIETKRLSRNLHYYLQIKIT